MSKMWPLASVMIAPIVLLFNAADADDYWRELQGVSGFSKFWYFKSEDVVDVLEDFPGMDFSSPTPDCQMYTSW